MGGGRYRLLTEAVAADWQEFKALSVSRSWQVDTDRAALGLEKAVSLYRGAYLEDLDYAWVLPWQEYYKNLYIEVRFHLARHYIGIKEYPEAIIHLNALLESNNLIEEIHELLLTSYAGLGDLAGLKQHYQNMTQLFKNELGLEPPPNIRTLYQKLCR